MYRRAASLRPFASGGRVRGSTGIAPFRRRSSASGNRGIGGKDSLEEDESVFERLFPVGFSSCNRARTRTGRTGVRVFGSAFLAIAHNRFLMSPDVIDLTRSSFGEVVDGSCSTKTLLTYFAVM